MLIKDFYKVIGVQYTETAFVANIELNSDHSVFDGHFPGNPVMPGVCMIQIIKELVEEKLNQKLFLQQVSNVKFMTLINPLVNNKLSVNFTIEEESNWVKVRSSISFLDTVALKMNNIYIKQ